MANEQNLIPFSERSKEEARELGRRGGIASGAARRRKRSLKEAADLYLSLPVRDKRRLNAIIRDGLEEDTVDNQMAIIVGLAKIAMTGDHKAAKVLFDLLGEDTQEQRNADNDGFMEALKGEATEAWQE